MSIRTQGPSPALSAATARCAARVVLPAPPFWLAKTIAFIIVLSCFLDRKNTRFRAFGLRLYRKEKQKARFILRLYRRLCIGGWFSSRLVVLSFFNERQKERKKEAAALVRAVKPCEEARLRGNARRHCVRRAGGDPRARQKG